MNTLSRSSRTRAVSWARPARAALALALAAVVAHSDALGAQRPLPGQGTPRTITLQDALTIALVQNSTVRVARNQTSLDSLTVRQLRNNFLPNFNAGSQSSQGFGAGSQGDNTFGTSLGVSSGVTLYNGGQNVNMLREAELNVRASGQDLARTRQSLVFVVASDFLNLITQQEQLRVQQENLTAQEEQLTQLEQFVKAGTRNIGDLYQQQAAVAAARLAVANARRATELAKVDLIQELVLDPRQNYDFVVPAAPTAAVTAGTFNLDSLIDVALQQRVDVQAQLLRVQAAEREIRVAEGGKLPVVTGSAGYSTGFTTGGTDFATQLAQRRGGSVGVSITLPIFDRGAASIARQRAQIQLENESLALRDQTQTVALEVRRAFLDYQSAQEQLAAANAQQTAAALALEVAQARYRAGLATFVEVTLARATLVQAQSAVVSSRSSLVFQQALMSYYTGVLDPANVRLGG
jgi:outer membrane protein